MAPLTKKLSYRNADKWMEKLSEIPWGITALLEYTKKGIELVCADGYKRRCYPILAGLMVDYEEQVLITGIKANM